MNIKDPVKLKVFNKATNETYIKDVIYERTAIEQWVTHQIKEMGAQFHEWEILEGVV